MAQIHRRRAAPAQVPAADAQLLGHGEGGVLQLLVVGGGAKGDKGVFQGDVRHVDGLPVAEGPAALHRGEQLPGKGVQHNAQHAHAVLHQPHGDGGGPVAANEVGGAVDGVNHPVPAGGHLVFLLLLGEEVGLGQQGGEVLNQKPLGGHVRLGDEIGVALLGVHVGPGDGANQLPGLFYNGNGLLGQLFQFHVVSLPFRPIIARRGTCRKLVRILLRNL